MEVLDLVLQHVLELLLIQNPTLSGRFISVIKCRPLVWRESHPYLIADRIEDITDPESVRVNPKVDRNVSLYGYVRGTSIKNRSNVHVAGNVVTL
jgi:ribosome biogenesis protein BMS1